MVLLFALIAVGLLAGCVRWVYTPGRGWSTEPSDPFASENKDYGEWKLEDLMKEGYGTGKKK
jgi:hypothetical protein